MTLCLLPLLKSARKRKGKDKMSKVERKKGIKNLFSRMHKFYFSRLQKPLLVSKMDVHNEQNANRSKQKKGMLQRGLDFIKKGKSGSDKNATTGNNAPVSSTKHKMKRKDNATTFSDDDGGDSDEEEDDSDNGEFLSSDNDISDSDDSDTEEMIENAAENCPREAMKIQLH